MPVSTKAKEYSEKLPQWVQVDDCINDRVKQKGVAYLPKPNPDDKSAENVSRYNQYLIRAIFMNVVKRTHDGFVGFVYRLPPTIELPTQTEYLEDSATQDGLDLTQFSKEVLSNTMNAGRGAILVDYPPSEGGTAAETDGLQAYMIAYKSEDVINWKVKNGKLVLVVIQGCYEVPIDEFESEIKEQYLVLKIDENGYYVQETWRDDALYDSVEPRQSSGQRWPFIPFTFVGTVNNDNRIDPSLLFSISDINIGHYRNSADLEENCFIHSQLTLGITSDLDNEQFLKANPQGVQVGSRAGHFLGSSGGFHSVQATENALAARLQNDKQEQMSAIGAQILEQGGPSETAEAVKTKSGANTATLSNLAHNVSAAITLACEWAGLFMGTTEDVTFRLNQDFFPNTVSPREMAALIQLYDRGRLAGVDVYNRLKEAGYIAEGRTFEDIEGEASEQDPLV